jgi:glutathione peroxidase
VTDLADISVTTLDGQTKNLGSFLGTPTLVVNVASQCGFTPQYTGLEALYRKYGDRGFTVLGFPCDQFGHQEPGNAEEIRNFCASNYQVTFPLFAKIEVNGPHAHPLYRELKKQAPGFLGIQKVKWNFTKFLISGDRRVVKRFAPTRKPEDLTGQIESLLPA